MSWIDCARMSIGRRERDPSMWRRGDLSPRRSEVSFMREVRGEITSRTKLIELGSHGFG